MDNNANLNKGLSIIVVEDNDGDFVLIEDYLYEQIKSITIEHYVNYKSVSAYLQCEDCKCDLILLDLHLPDMHGLELIKNMITLSSKVPIIILTGYSDLSIAKKSLEMGIYDFLIKDEINPSLLHKSIEFAISRSSYIRHIESQNEKLKNIAWTQSHVVRAPLARILSIISMIETQNEDTKEQAFWLDQLKISSNEMDLIVRNIVNEAQALHLDK